MRALLGSLISLLKKGTGTRQRRRLAALCLLAAVSGCAWGSTNGVPWWGSKKDKEKATADLAKYGPFAFQRIAEIKSFEEYAAKGDAAAKQKVADNLAQRIQTEQDALVRKQIIRTLATIPNETASAVLYTAIRDPDPEIREEVCRDWGKRAKEAAAARKGAPAPPGSIEDTAVRLLAEALSGDTNMDVRLAAARALGNIPHDPRAVGALALALRDSDPAMQYYVVASLKETSGKDFGNDVGKWTAWAATVVPPPAQNPGQPPEQFPSGPALASRPPATH